MEMNDDKSNNKDDTDMKINDVSDDEKLPQVLEKLEIVPLMPMIKLQDEKLPLLLNPFYFNDNNKNRQIKSENSDDDDESIKIKSDEDDIKKIFGNTIKCGCNIRKQQQQTQNHNNIEHNIVKQTRFKRKNSLNSKRIYLKESLLKTIQSCCIHTITSQSTTLSMNTATPITTTTKGTILEFSDYPTLEDLRLEDDAYSQSASTTKISSLSLNSRRNAINYRIFIKDFDLLSTCCNLSSSPSLTLSVGRNEKNFTTLQTSDNRLIRNPCTRRLTLNNNNKDEMKYVSKYLQQNSILNGTASTSTSAGSSSSSSCSQQARNNQHSSSMMMIMPTTTTTTATTTAGGLTATGTSTSTTAVSCDITIDELACYFETFVHIPKKMSEMAEMMYI